VSLVTKVRDTAGSVYGQAKARYAGSDTMQKAGRQAGQAAGQAAGKVREISGKATSAVKNARPRRPGQQ